MALPAAAAASRRERRGAGNAVKGGRHTGGSERWGDGGNQKGMGALGVASGRQRGRGRLLNKLTIKNLSMQAQHREII